VSAPEALTAELEQLVRREQRDKRLPSIAAAVTRAGEPVWETAVGAADVRAEREATPDTQLACPSKVPRFWPPSRSQILTVVS